MGEAPPDYELSNFSYQHTILAVAAVVEADQDAVPVTLYRWYPPAISASTSVVLPLAMLLAISGFAPLGTFFVPDDLDISSALSQLLTAAPPPSQHLEGQLLASLMAQLCIVPGRGGGTFRQFFSFPVFSNRPDLYFSMMACFRRGNGLSPMGIIERRASGRQSCAKLCKTESGLVAEV